MGARKRKYFDHVIVYLMALGVSVMICDAILHLIPHSFGLHAHGETDRYIHLKKSRWFCVVSKGVKSIFMGGDVVDRNIFYIICSLMLVNY